LENQNENPGLEERTFRWTRIGTIATTVGALAAVAYLIVYLWNLRPPPVQEAKTGHRVAAEPEIHHQAEEFRVTYPTEDSVVEMNLMVRGKTLYPNMNHYLVVMPYANKTNYVENGHVDVLGDSFVGPVTLGEAAAGGGERFFIRALATRTVLSSGALLVVPGDAIFSEGVTVTRVASRTDYQAERGIAPRQQDLEEATFRWTRIGVVAAVAYLIVYLLTLIPYFRYRGPGETRSGRAVEEPPSRKL
jgi:hypothetical protein